MLALGMTVEVRYVTDPVCPESWALEPVVRRLERELGDELRWTFVMGGLARSFDADGGGRTLALVKSWLDAGERGGMPVDPRLWLEGPLASSHPACLAMKAAAEQAPDGGARYLRALREGVMCFRRKLDGTEALVEEARRAGLDVERFRRALGSSATVEAFAADAEEAAALGALPALVFKGADGACHVVAGDIDHEACRAAALAAGAAPSEAPAPGVLDALRRWGRLSTTEVEAVCGLPGPRAAAELWRLALEWQVRPVRVLTGTLWEPA
jgi:predicted DsbA family dithiol-disulfide isomerase